MVVNEGSDLCALQDRERVLEGKRLMRGDHIISAVKSQDR